MSIRSLLKAGVRLGAPPFTWRTLTLLKGVWGLADQTASPSLSSAFLGGQSPWGQLQLSHCPASQQRT